MKTTILKLNYLMITIFSLRDKSLFGSSFLVLLVLLLGRPVSAQVDLFTEKYEAFLSQELEGQSLNYSSLDLNTITALKSTIANSEWQVLNQSDQLSFLINAYNTSVIIKIKEHYPIRSVGEVTDFFNSQNQIGSTSYSLDQLEEFIVSLGGAGMHLLLNCGAKSCPPLQFITPEKLDISLALASASEVLVRIIGDGIEVSKIFSWYDSDFGGRAGVIEFLNKNGRQVESSTELKYMSYDWLLNDLSMTETNIYFPTRLYKRGEGEFKVFNNYYTQKQNGVRSNFFSSFIQLLIGTNKRINYGLDVKFRSVSSGSVSLFDALNFRNQSFSDVNGLSTYARTGISGIGPRIKYQPFKSKPNINFLHAVYFVPMDEAEGNENFGYSDYDDIQIFNQMFIEKELSPTRRLFIDLGFHIENLRLGVHRNFNHFTPIQIPASVFYNYFPSPYSTIYAMATIAQRVDLFFNPDTDTRAEYSLWGQVGLGGKYILSNAIEFEALYTRFFVSTFDRPSQTFNLGIRVYR